MKFLNTILLGGVLVSSYLTTVVDAHAFVLCTNGQGTKDGTCKGFGRSLQNLNPKNDVLFAFRPGKTDVACNPFNQARTANIFDAYPAQFPMTKAQPGQVLTLQWQANRHTNGTVEIFKGNVKKFPNTKINVFMVGPNVPLDPPRSQFDQAKNKVATLQFGDSACNALGDEKFRLCAGQIKMPTAPGVYTFHWTWVFNETYSSCFDIQVGNTNLPKPTDANTLKNQLAKDTAAVQKDGTQTFTNAAALQQNKLAAEAAAKAAAAASKTASAPAAATTTATAGTGKGGKGGRKGGKGGNKGAGNNQGAQTTAAAATATPAGGRKGGKGGNKGAGNNQGAQTTAAAATATPAAGTGKKGGQQQGGQKQGGRKQGGRAGRRGGKGQGRRGGRGQGRRRHGGRSLWETLFDTDAKNEQQ